MLARAVCTLLAVLIPAAFSAGPSSARADGPVRGVSVAEAETFAQWSSEVWQSATRGDGESALELLSTLPATGTLPESSALGASISQYRVHLDEREASRAERLDELDGELDAAEADGDLPGALKALVEMHTLSLEPARVLTSPTARRVIERAERGAETAELEGRWLDAHTLYNRLHLLYETGSPYKDDLRRLGLRLLMLRLYAPERLHEMRSAQRVAEGEEALPPYNALADDWREKLAGINDRMVMQALNQAARLHVDQAATSDVLVGGFEALRTFATTTDLASSFAGLGDPDAVRRFIDRIDGFIAGVRDRGPRADIRDIMLAIRMIREANRETIEVPEEALYHEFGEGAAGTLDDFSDFIWPDELSRFDRTTKGNFVGVGIQITLNDALQLKVVTPLQGTPAARAGVRSDDLITHIDGDATLGMGLSQAVERITGDPGTSVTLTVERENEAEPMRFALRREVIPLYSVKGWRRSGPEETEWDWFIEGTGGIGYVRLSQFIKGTSDELRAALRQMRRGGMEGLIIDLRYNPGGLLDEAVDVVSLFVDRGVVVTQEDGQGRVRDMQTARPGRQLVDDDLPVVVLINGGSASASEIVAGALQDYGRAVVVGERSYGKGSVQNIFMLGAAGHAAFKLTTQYYKLPSGRLIHRRDNAAEFGVEPDVSVEMLPQQIGDALTLRQDADVVAFDDRGRLIPDPERPDPSDLLDDGIDPQLETAVLLIHSRLAGERVVRRAALR